MPRIRLLKRDTGPCTMPAEESCALARRTATEEGRTRAFPARLGRADTFQVELTTQESLDIARVAEPVSGGVPLPAGEFKTDQPFTLLDEDNNEVACQTSPLVVDTDGRLRWVLLDFQDDVAAGETSRYLLCSGKSPAKPPAALKIDDNGRRLAIDTGRITIALDRTKRFGLFDSVSAIIKASATRFLSPAPKSDGPTAKLRVRSGWVAYSGTTISRQRNSATATTGAIAHHRAPNQGTLRTTPRFRGSGTEIDRGTCSITPGKFGFPRGSRSDGLFDHTRPEQLLSGRSCWPGSERR